MTLDPKKEEREKRKTSRSVLDSKFLILRRSRQKKDE